MPSAQLCRLDDTRQALVKERRGKMLISGKKINLTSDGTVNKFAFLKVFRRGAGVVFMRKQCRT